MAAKCELQQGCIRPPGHESECALAESAATVGELVELCTRIQQNAHAIPVRVNLGGKWESKFLSEMPAELAVWWALQFVLRRLLGPDADDKFPPAEGS